MSIFDFYGVSGGFDVRSNDVNLNPFVIFLTPGPYNASTFNNLDWTVLFASPLTNGVTQMTFGISGFSSGLTFPQGPTFPPAQPINYATLYVPGASVQSGATFSFDAVTVASLGANPAQLIAGNDTFRGTDFADHFYAGPGNDLLVGQGGADFLDGGDGSDSVSYSESPAGVSINLATGAVSGGDADGDTLVAIENIDATIHADLIVGDANNNSIETESGNDIAWGGAGDDTIRGESLNGTVDRFYGEDGNDSIYCLYGNDFVSGGGGDDQLSPSLGFDTALYSVASTQATWTRSASSFWTVTAGADGVDHLLGVEVLRFSDRDVYLDPPRENFALSGASDILFRNTSGVNAVWSVSGSAITGSFALGSVGSDWTLAGTGHFFGMDLEAGILWLRNDGTLVEWHVRNHANIEPFVVGNVGPTWHVAGVADANRDGHDDIFWRNDNGAIAVWTMNDSTPQSSSVIGYVDNSWTISGVADFDGDGHDEILWRHTSGLVATWSTDGASITGNGNLGYVDTSWTLAGTGDFNDDGRADILWVHNGDGVAVIWEMNGATIQSAGYIGTVGATWHVANVGDYNGDGNADILWRNDNGAVAVWTMNGFTPTSSGVVGYVDTNWSII